MLNIHSLIVCMTTNLDKLSDWSSINELDFQPKKCENLRISRKRISFDRSYRINNVELKCTSTQKDLGIHITSDLSWDKHIESITAKANRMLGFLKRNCSRILPKTALKTLYLALVRSHLGYCSQVWAPQSVIKNMLLIESVQRRATKFICFNLELNYRDRLYSLNLLPLNYWFEYLDLVFFFKCKMNEITIDLSNYLNFCSSRTKRGTTGLYIRGNTIPRTTTFRDSFFQRIVNMWNALPEDIKAASSLNIFKKKLKDLFYRRLNAVFNQDDIRTYKIICVKCRSTNVYSACSC